MMTMKMATRCDGDRDVDGDGDRDVDGDGDRDVDGDDDRDVDGDDDRDVDGPKAVDYYPLYHDKDDAIAASSINEAHVVIERQ